MRAKYPRLTVVAQLWLLPDIILEIQEGYLLSGIDGFIDAVNDQVNAFVIVFDTILCSDVPPQILCLVPASHLRELGHQLLTFFLGDELGGFHRIDQQLNLRDIILAADQVIALLGGHHFLDLHAKRAQCSDIGRNRLPVDFEAIFLFEDLHKLSSSQIMILVCAFVKNLCQIKRAKL